MLCNRHITTLSLKALKDFISDTNFIKIGRLLSFNEFLRYVTTISTWSTNNPNKQEITRNMHSNSLLTIREKVLLKSIPCIYQKSYATSFALY